MFVCMCVLAIWCMHVGLGEYGLGYCLSVMVCALRYVGSWLGRLHLGEIKG